MKQQLISAVLPAAASVAFFLLALVVLRWAITPTVVQNIPRLDPRGDAPKPVVSTFPEIVELIAQLKYAKIQCEEAASFVRERFRPKKQNGPRLLYGEARASHNACVAFVKGAIKAPGSRHQHELQRLLQRSTELRAKFLRSCGAHNAAQSPTTGTGPAKASKPSSSFDAATYVINLAELYLEFQELEDTRAKENIKAFEADLTDTEMAAWSDG